MSGEIRLGAHFIKDTGFQKRGKTMARTSVRHELKTWPEFFKLTILGRKRFELRRDDRPEGFYVGDELLLREWDPAIEEPYGPGEGGKYKGYTGRTRLVRVDYIMDADMVRQLIHPLLEPDEMDEFVIMSVAII